MILSFYDFILYKTGGIFVKLSFKNWIFKIVLNLLGLFLCSFGIVLLIESSLGASPWDVFQVGMTNYVDITIGQASQIIAFIIVIINLFFKVIPGVGTILNAFFVGYFIDLIYKFNILKPESLLFKLLYFCVGMIFFGFGIVIALKAKIGVGSRDALMEVLVNLSKQSVVKIRSILEIIAGIFGIVLGGPFGIGTLVAAFSLGYIINFAAKILDYEFDAYNHYTLKDSYLKYKSII